MPLFGPVAFGTIALLALRWRMNVMSLPDEGEALGVPTGLLRIAIVAAAALVTSASVATRRGSSAGSGLSCRIARIGGRFSAG